MHKDSVRLEVIGAVAALMVGVPAAGIAQGEIITFGYTGTITGANYYYGTPPADPIEVGDAFSGWFEVDTETPDNATGSEFYGEYQRFGRVAFQIRDILGIGPKTPWMRIDAGDYDNQIEVSDGTTWEYGGYEFGELVMKFAAPEGQTVLADDSLPTMTSDFDGLTNRSLLIGFTPADYSYLLIVGGRIDSLYLIPEPSSFLSAWVLAMVALRRRRGM